MARKSVLIAGAGGIGRATALILREIGPLDVDILLGDADAAAAEEAAQWVADGSTAVGEVEAFLLPREGSSPAFDQALERADILLDCLPGAEAPRMAKAALEHRLHYANLTEYVAETEEIRRIAAGAETGFLLQTGLAPGVIDVLGLGLFRRFCRRFGVDAVDRIGLRVGALPTLAPAPHFYGFTWSPIGVATEYVEAAIVVRGGEVAKRPALSDREQVLLDGILYEEALTSGGAADLPEALGGRVRDLDYKTLRYPGHYAWVETIVDALPPSERPAALERRMLEAIPRVEQDVVVLHAFVEGRDAEGALRRDAVSRRIRPMQVGRRVLKAIQSTTAAGLAESTRLLLDGGLRGPILQSQIDPDDYLGGVYVDTVYRSAGLLDEGGATFAVG